MDNMGKIIEAWLATCKGCGIEKILNWDNGTSMSFSQAKRILEKNNWKIVNGDWYCPECITD